MIHIYGDSHARALFKDLKIPNTNYFKDSITMFRIGRDNIIINFNNNITKDDVVCITYGEVDCRCHIQRQINLGNTMEIVCNDLVNKYMQTIKSNIQICKAIIVIAIIPPTNQQTFEAMHGPITHEFPFVGTNEQRVQYSRYMNELLEQKCKEYGYIFFNPYAYYTDPEGCLQFELSDTLGHLKDTAFFHSEFTKVYETIYN